MSQARPRPEGPAASPNVVAQRLIAAPRHEVYAWLEDSRHYTASPMVAACPWRRPGDAARFGPGAVRDVIMVAGWYREQITTTVPGREIRYRVLRSLPPVRQDLSRITLTDLGTPGQPLTQVRWEVEVEVKVPLVGRLLTRASAPVASALYSTILAAAERHLTSPGPAPRGRS